MRHYCEAFQAQNNNLLLQLPGITGENTIINYFADCMRLANFL